MRKIFLKLLIIAVFFSFSYNSAEASTNKPVPILMYHSVSEVPFTQLKNLFVRPIEFEKQVKLIVEKGFTPIFANELDNADQYKKPIVITFDDGYKDNYEIVYPIIKKYNTKITIFMITDFINRNHYLTLNSVREMSNSGLVSIQSHTSTHKQLTKLNDAQLESELRNSKKAIGNLLNKEPITIAYPYGAILQNQLSIVGKYYRYGFTTTSGVMSNGGNNHTIKRYPVNRDTQLDSIRSYLNAF